MLASAVELPSQQIAQSRAKSGTSGAASSAATSCDTTSPGSLFPDPLPSSAISRPSKPPVLLAAVDDEYTSFTLRKLRLIVHQPLCTGSHLAVVQMSLEADALPRLILLALIAAGKATAEVAVIMGSDSDLATMRAAAEALSELDIECEVTVVSAHRTPDRMLDFARQAHKRGIKVG